MPYGANKIAAQNQEGLLYDIGTGLGIATALAFNPALPGAAWAKGAASVYQDFAIVHGIADSTKNVLTGQASAWDALNLLPVASFALHNRKAIGGALMKAGDLGLETQPRLILAGESLAASATRVADRQSDNGFQHFMAAITTRDGWIGQAIERGANPLNKLGYANLGENTIQKMKDNNVTLKKVSYDKTPLSEAARQYRLDNPNVSYGNNVAAVSFENKLGKQESFVIHSQSGRHSERLLLENEEFLAKIGGENNLHKIQEFYTELQPCNITPSYCLSYLVEDRNLSNIKISYSFSYTDYSNNFFGRNIRNYDKREKANYFKQDSALEERYRGKIR